VQHMCMCISVMCKFTARGRFCVTQTLENTTESYTNFVLQKVALKDEEHIYAYHRIIHTFCITKIAPQR
jgi:hypothetical protein